MATGLIPPYGGRLVDLLVADPDERRAWAAKAAGLPSVILSPRSMCDLELLATGAFSPLDRFMREVDYWRVLAGMRLADGTLFPIPITLPVPADLRVGPGDLLALRSARRELLAVMTVEERFVWDRAGESEQVCGTTDSSHPLVAEMSTWGPFCVSGPLLVLDRPAHYSFTDLRHTPPEVRRRLEAIGPPRVVAFQTRNPMHRAHEELTKRAMREVDGTLLIHPVVGLTQPGDIDFFTRVRCYKALVGRYYDRERTVLSLLPLAMRMAGPREAVWHAIIRRNYGVSHLIVGRDHAGPGKDSRGRPFYGPFDAQQLAIAHQRETGVTILAFDELVYLPDEDRYEEARRAVGTRSLSLSGTQVRADYLARGRRLPAWFTRPEVNAILGEVSVPEHRRGLCVWFTGLSGAGKSTVADILAIRLMEHGRAVTLLDGDVVRTHLSKGLGFSREDRDTNILRIGFVASEVVRHHGTVICAAISPYAATRDQVRSLVGEGHFVLVHLDTPLAVCEARDPKGLYARARRGEVQGVTGIDDPYEAPAAAEIVLDTASLAPAETAERIVRYLVEKGFLRQDESGLAS